MTFKSRTLIATAVLTLFSTGVVLAQSTAPAAGAPPAAMEKPMSAKDMSAAFVKADANKDGKLDKMEAEGVPGLVARFEQVDTDADKTVSKAEFDKVLKP